MERRSSQSPSVSISPRRRHSASDTEDDGHTSTTSCTTAAPESIFLTFMESKFHELGRKQQLLIEREHELNQREKALETQMAQVHFYNGYVKGMLRGRGRGYRGYRGRHVHENTNANVDEA